jgi:hypothetical protein
MSTALDAIRVVDLSTGIAGPVAAMLLADFGADVIKVELPTGDPARSLPGFAVWNRNKRSIVVERATAAGQERLGRLLAGADLCILSEPSIANDPLKLSATYPHLVVVHTPPYTPTHTPWAGGTESHSLLDAVAGPSARQSSFDGGPIDLVYPTTLYVQGRGRSGRALIERHRSSGLQGARRGGHPRCDDLLRRAVQRRPQPQPVPTSVGLAAATRADLQAQDGRWLFLTARQKFQAMRSGAGDRRLCRRAIADCPLLCCPRTAAGCARCWPMPSGRDRVTSGSPFWKRVTAQPVRSANATRGSTTLRYELMDCVRRWSTHSAGRC